VGGKNWVSLSMSYCPISSGEGMREKKQGQKGRGGGKKE